MSQRTFSALVVFLLFLIVGLYALTTGQTIPLKGDAALVAFLAPVVLIFTTLNTLFDVIDSRVAESKLKPGDLLGLLTLSEFWIAIIAALSGIVQVFGYKLIAPETQTVLVNAFLLITTVLLRSLSDRGGKDPVPVAQKAQQRE